MEMEPNREPTDFHNIIKVKVCFLHLVFNSRGKLEIIHFSNFCQRVLLTNQICLQTGNDPNYGLLCARIRVGR